VVNRFDRSWEEAASDLGATSWQRLRHVTLPILMPGIMGVAIAAFTLSYDEYARTTLTIGAKNTLPLEIYALISSATSPTLFAIGTITTAASFLLIAVIFLASWGSIAATLNSLSSCTIVDFHKRFSRKELTGIQEYKLSRMYTLFWGIFCVGVAQLAYNIGNSLIEAVNLLGSLFYGVILGIFLVAFYRKKIGGTAVFVSAVIVEAFVILLNILNNKGIVHLSFLWFNVVGAVGVVILSELIGTVSGRRPGPKTVE